MNFDHHRAQGLNLISHKHGVYDPAIPPHKLASLKLKLLSPQRRPTHNTGEFGRAQGPLIEDWEV